MLRSEAQAQAAAEPPQAAHGTAAHSAFVAHAGIDEAARAGRRRCWVVAALEPGLARRHCCKAVARSNEVAHADAQLPRLEAV